MISLIEHYPWVKSLWTLWFFLLFVCIVTWVMWPSRREEWRELGRIPLQDHGERRPRSKRN
ncbi:cbb3-type cytochrome c oxidase subunit 3 [uncultured Ferrovibrio sp.]|jgi:cytochrome c oxidase cbb3-type subunit 4|uniref:cbb3-type cytochrome c oxidase subunit 3 n=1 Tax=uncultured Ferrovibrio sp. TaxID=1576913 RepID=UPI00260CD97B|nr:cbb3-type cytochrome c oxidase subunit 3 [uncultured Ferrovibrio sp.]